MYYLLHSYKRVRVNTIDYDRSCANVTLHVLLNLQRNRYSQKGNVEVVALTLKLHPDAAIPPATARRHTIPCMGYYATLLSARNLFYCFFQPRYLSTSLGTLFSLQSLSARLVEFMIKPRVIMSYIKATGLYSVGFLLAMVRSLGTKMADLLLCVQIYAQTSHPTHDTLPRYVWNFFWNILRKNFKTYFKEKDHFRRL